MSGSGTIPRTTRDRVLDGGAFLLAAAWAGLITWLAWAGLLPLSRGAMVADVAAGWMGVAGLWLRRRWPVGLAVLLVTTGLFSLASGMAALIALFTVAVRRRPAITLALGGAYAATGIPYVAVHGNPLQGGDNPFWFDVLWGAVFPALAVAWGLFARARHQLLLSLADRAHRAETEQHLRVEQARHLERERIAREMHDVLAHRISLVSMQAGGLEFRTDASGEEIRRAAGVIRHGAHQALQDLREVIGVLRAGPDDPHRPQPTLADLPVLFDEVRQGGTRVRCDDQVADPAAVPAGVARTAYRIVQEGLTNARKHAEGATVDVALSGAAGSGLTVSVRNRRPVGRPAASPIPGTGTGLIGLAERVTLAGGTLEHGPEPDGGFGLRAWLPWSE